MRSLISRIEKLKNDKQGRARTIIVRTGSEHSPADVSTMLKAKGIVTSSADNVVCFATIYLDKSGNDLPADSEPVLLSVH